MDLAATDKRNTMKLSKISTFLNSIERNSASSKNAYSSGLFHVTNFISQRVLKVQLRNDSCTTVKE